MNRAWRLLGRTLGYLTWPLVYLAIWPTTRTKVLVISNDKILLLRGWLDTGSWSCPGGGLHRKEAPEIGAIRELKEEVGISVAARDLKPLGTFRQTRGFRCRLQGFVVVLPNQPPTTKQRFEVAEADWFPLDQLSDIPAQQHVGLLLEAWRKQR